MLRALMSVLIMALIMITDKNDNYEASEKWSWSEGGGGINLISDQWETNQETLK